MPVIILSLPFVAYTLTLCPVIGPAIDATTASIVEQMASHPHMCLLLLFLLIIIILHTTSFTQNQRKQIELTSFTVRSSSRGVYRAPSPLNHLTSLGRLVVLSSALTSFAVVSLRSPVVVSTPSACGKEKTSAEAFTCLFQNITFAIPNLHIPNIKGKISLDVDDLSCHHLAITYLDLNTKKPTSVEHDVVATIEGGTLSCFANIKLSHIPVFGTVKASVNFDISKLQFSAAILLQNENKQHSELPTSAKMTVPTSHPTPDLSLTLHLSGNWIIKIINALGKGLLENEIKKVILSSLSTELPSAVTPLLNKLVHNVSDIVAPYLDPPSSVPLPSNDLPKDVVPIRWDQGLAGNAMYIVSKLAADKAEDNVPLLSHLIDFVGIFLGWEQGSIALNLDQTIHIGNDGLSSSTNITISTIKISGLDGLKCGVDDLHILDPDKASRDQVGSNGLQLATRLRFPDIIIEMDGIVSVAPGSIIGTGEGTLTAPAKIKIELINVSMDLTLLLALNWDEWKDLSLGQMLSLPCLKSAMSAVNITRLDLVSLLNPEHPPTVTFLSPGIDQLMNEIVGVIDGLYAQVLSESIRGLMAGPIRDLINDLSVDILSNTTDVAACLPMPAPTDILPNRTTAAAIEVKSMLLSKSPSATACDKYGDDETKCDASPSCAFCMGGWAHTHGCYTKSAAGRLPPSMFQCDHTVSSKSSTNNSNPLMTSSSSFSKAGQDVPLDWGSNPIVTLLFGLVDVVLNIEDKPLLYTVNDAVSALTNHTGQYSLHDLIDLDVHFENIQANVSIPYLLLSGLNQLSDVDMEANDASHLKLNLAANKLRMDVGVDLSLLVTDPEDPTSIVTNSMEKVELSLILPKSRLGVDSMDLLIDATSLAHLDVQHLMASPGCFGQTLHSMKLNNLILNLENITIELRCRDDEVVTAAGRRGTTNGTTKNTTNATCTKSLQAFGLLLEDNTSARAQLTSLIERLLRAATNATLGQPIVHLLNNLASGFVNDSTKMCRAAPLSPSSLTDSTDSFNFVTSPSSSSSSSSSGGNVPTPAPYTGIYPVVSFWLGVFSCLSFLAAIVVGAFMQCRASMNSTKKKSSSSNNNNNNNDLTSPLLDPTAGDQSETFPGQNVVVLPAVNGGNDSDRLASDRASDRDFKKIMNEDVALMFHPDVPPYARVSMPLFLLSGALMYLSGNLNVGASVFVNVSFADLEVPLPSLFDFSLGNSVRDMWSAKVYPLALLILLFSGVWPYVKLVMMLMCWVVPPSSRCRCCGCGRGRGMRVLSPERRGMWLQALDALGKWSLIDTFVLVMMMVAFRFHIQNQQTWNWIEFLPDNFLVVDVIVKPNWGIFAFIIATVISLLSTHVVIAFHRAAAGSSLDAEDTSSIAVRRFSLVDSKVQHRVALKDHIFHYRNAKFGYTHAACTLFGKFCVILLLCGTMFLVCAGSWWYSFSFEFEGLAGTLLGAPPTDYSLISLANSILPSSGSIPTGTAVLWVTFMLFALVIPLVYLVLTSILYVVPLTLYEQRKIHVTVEVLHAWGALEVFVLAIVAALLELKQFAGFIVGGRCNMIDKYIRTYLSDALPSGDMVCFTVVTKLLSGTFVLVAASLLLIFIGQYIMRISEHSLEDRTRRDNGKSDENSKEDWGLGTNCCADGFQIALCRCGLLKLEKRY